MRRRFLNTVTWSRSDIMNLTILRNAIEPSISYENVIIENKEPSKTLLPKKRKFEFPDRHADIAEPRKMVNEAYKMYVISNSEEDYDNLHEAKRKLQETYDKIKIKIKWQNMQNAGN